ncbi:subtilisin-like protease SBT5.3 [Benincasa hispida]|uniref:subtilisin-like protease SBT5.3 n=1 Tax=Benincasa hispida TaxID=102211 RepID=UPI00190162FE|nr:subtilisin-like protease SBT5.3 [Benincasa hispida]
MDNWAVKHHINVYKSPKNCSLEHGQLRWRELLFDNLVCISNVGQAASYLDRDFVNYVVLGNEKHFKGPSLSSGEMPEGKFYPLINAVEAKAVNASDNLAPAAIKSAIMTTANTRDSTMHPILDFTNVEATPFDYGAGQVNPNDAIDPGLVYDTTIDDCLNFLCARGYNNTQLKKFSNKPFVCAKSFAIIDLNYPSISIPKLTIDGPVTINRRVKNVGSPGTYVAHVKVPEGIAVSVEPNTLQFNNVGEEKAFKVVFRHIGQGQHQGYVFGTLIWSDGKHFLRSPIAMKLG